MGCFDSASKSETSKSYIPAQRNWLETALKIYGPTLGQGQESFPGQRVAPLSMGQQQALDVGDYLKFFSPDTDIPMYGQTGQALSGILSGKTGAQPYTKEAGEKYFTSVYADPTYKRWQEKILPEIKSAYAGPGYWGSARANAVAKGATDMGDWLGQQYGQTMWDIEQANRAIEEAKAGRALSAVGLGMDYGGVPTREAMTRLAGRGGVYDMLERERMHRQTEINAEIQKWAESKNITDPQNLEILMNLLSMNYQSARSSSQGPGLGYSMASNLMGNAPAALSSIFFGDNMTSPITGTRF